MPTTLKSIAKYLENRNWNYQIDYENNRIFTGVKAQNIEPFFVVIQITENDEFLQVIAPQLFHIKDHVFKGVFFQTLLSISYETKMVRFAYDPSDGEVCASIELPLEDTPLSEKQFNRILGSLISLVDDYAALRLKAVLAKGIDPGTRNLAECLLEDLPEELITLLERAILQRRNTNVNPTE